MGIFIDLNDVRVWRVEPTGTPKGGLIVIHEIWGLVEHIRDVAERFAAEGYMVYAPDLLSAAGTTPEIGEELQGIMDSDDEEKKSAAQPRLRAAFAPVNAPDFAAPTVQRLTTVLDALEQEPGVDGRIGVVGYCFGGSYAFALAAADPRVKAAVPYYGAAPSADAMHGIGCPVLAIYGEDDPRLIDALPEVTGQMADASVDFRTIVYPEAGHAFFNDTNHHRYHEASAKAAWGETLSFLDRTLNPAG